MICNVPEICDAILIHGDPVCRMPASDGLGQFSYGKWNPFNHVSITGGNYASPPHIDEKDVGMNFIWCLQGVQNVAS